MVFLSWSISPKSAELYASTSVSPIGGVRVEVAERPLLHWVGKRVGKAAGGASGGQWQAMSWHMPM